jgi:uncharacterized protein YecE (DUF72 family)
MAGQIRVGIGGWTYEPWRDGVFFPPKWPARRELEYASRKLTAIEVNGTYYSGFKPDTFAKWRTETPDDFVFTLKASRFCTNRKVLATAEESVAKFVSQGVVELGPKLGPILWQFMATKKFDPDDFKAFIALLPASQDGVPLRHAIQVRHASFHTPEFVAMCRAAGVAIVYADSADYPAIADVTGSFVYARLEDAKSECETGYTDAGLDRWAEVARGWARGEAPDGLPYADAASHTQAPARDVFVFMINGAKERAPAAAMALIGKLSQ